MDLKSSKINILSHFPIIISLHSNHFALIYSQWILTLTFKTLSSGRRYFFTKQKSVEKNNVLLTFTVILTGRSGRYGRLQNHTCQFDHSLDSSRNGQKSQGLTMFHVPLQSFNPPRFIPQTACMSPLYSRVLSSPQIQSFIQEILSFLQTNSWP